MTQILSGLGIGLAAVAIVLSLTALNEIPDDDTTEFDNLFTMIETSSNLVDEKISASQQLQDEELKGWLKTQLLLNKVISDANFMEYTKTTEKLEGQVLELERAKEAIAGSIIEIPEKDIPPRKVDFEMTIINTSGDEQYTFNEGDSFFIQGNASESKTHSFHVKFWAPDTVLEEGRPNVNGHLNGDFNTGFTIPIDPQIGVWTVSVTDGFYTDSITFTVQ